MKLFQYLALIGVIGSAEALHLNTKVKGGDVCRGGVDPVHPDDVNLPELFQVPVQTTCDFAYNRLLYQSKGKITPKAGTCFEDTSFPADWTTQDWDKVGGFKPQGWVRPKEFKGKVHYNLNDNRDPLPATLYGTHGVRPLDVAQGMLGNCWFLAGISGIAEFPNKIHKIFRGINTLPTNGQVVVDVYLYGKPHRMFIDDRLPLADKENMILYNSQPSRDGSWWAQLLEKVGAKYFGNYRQMGGGVAAEVLNIFLNDPNYVLANQREHHSTLWKKLHDLNRKNHILNTGTAPGLSASQLFGVVGGHAYSTLDTAQYTDLAGAKHNLVKVRNPWAKEKYIGPWNDASTEMTKDNNRAMRVLGHNKDDDGSFWMPIQLYQQIFYATEVSLSGTNWKRAFKMAGMDRANYHPSQTWRFNNPRDQAVSFKVQAPSWRMYKTRSCNSPIRPDKILLKMRNAAGNTQTKVNLDNLWVDQTSGYWITHENLPAGDYDIVQVFVYMHSKTGGFNFGLTALGSEQVPTWY